MTDAPTITADQVRAALLARIDAFITASGRSASWVGKQAVQDDRFVSRIRSGGNFSLQIYQRVMDWLDEQERAAA